MITLTLTEESLEKNLELVLQAKDSIRLIELRADYLPSNFILSDERKTELQSFVEQIHSLNLQAIFTLRQVVDKGLYNRGVSEATSWYELAVECGFDYIDIDEDFFANCEFGSKLTSWKEVPTLTIVISRHDFDEVPSNFVEWVYGIATQGFVPKLAVMVKNPKELLRFYDYCLKLREVKKVVVGMGVLGFITRVCTKLFRSLWSYSAISSVTAELGHISPIDLDKIYGYYSIEENWEIYGIVGNPVIKSKSPQIQNNFFSQQGMSKIYIPFQTDNFCQFIEVAKALKIRGLSVTVPFKEEAAKIATYKEEAVKSIKAANTLLFNYNSESATEIYAYNSDAEGFKKPLLEVVPSSKLANSKVCLIGAGGASKAIIYVLKELGCQLFLFNRSYEKAINLVNEFSYGKAYPLEALVNFSSFDIVINSSTAGMGELSHIDLSEGYNFSGNEVVYDIVYYPSETKMLARAKLAGCKTIGGIKMLEAQAVKQSKLFGYGVESLS